jgi:N-acyl-D-aspartate/D-glutamate deacylase
MTGLPADILGLRDRGYIREGLAADLVVFDPNRVTDRSTYAQPTLRPGGIECVVVSGAVAVKNGRVTGVRAGQTLRARSGGHHRVPGAQ